MGNKSSKDTSAAGNSSGDGSSGSGSGSGSSSNDNNGSDDNEERIGFFAMAKQGYEQLVKSIIRPPRCSYNLSRLGPVEFEFGGRMFERKDFTVTNPRGLKVVCSIWGPKSSHEKDAQVMPCVVYMHGNSSARLEAIPELSAVLSIGARLLAFDFSGSGLSEGEYVSLGFFEKDDLQSVIEYLRSQNETSTIALWGRSMGAVTSLMHGKRDPSIASMILDSPFADLTILAEELVETGRKQGIFAPSFAVSLAIRWVRSDIEKRANFDIRDLAPITHVDNCFIPALFVAANGDNFITPKHSKSLCEKYAGDHRLRVVEGDHNSPRSLEFKDEATRFLINTLQIEEKSILNVDTSSYHNAPPWAFSHGGGNGYVTGDYGMMMGIEGDMAEDVGELDINELLLMNAISLSLQDNCAAVGGNVVGLPSDSNGGGAGVGGIGLQQANSPTGDSDIGMTDQRQQQLQNTINSVFRMGTSTNTSTSNSSSNNSNSSNSSLASTKIMKVLQGELQWECLICTLINDPTANICLACESLRG